MDFQRFAGVGRFSPATIAGLFAALASTIGGMTEEDNLRFTHLLGLCSQARAALRAQLDCENQNENKFRELATESLRRLNELIQFTESRLPKT